MNQRLLDQSLHGYSVSGQGRSVEEVGRLQAVTSRVDTKESTRATSIVTNRQENGQIFFKGISSGGKRQLPFARIMLCYTKYSKHEET